MDVFRHCRPLYRAALLLACLLAPAAWAADPQAGPDLAARIEALGELGRFAPAQARTALRQLEGAARAAPAPVKNAFLFHLSQAERGTGDTKTALRLADELIASAESKTAPDQAGLARGLLSKATTLSELKQLKASHALVWRADSLATAIATANGQAALRVDTAVAGGQAHAEDGDYPAALAALVGAANLARQTGQVIPQVVALNALARLYDQLKEYDKGFAALDEAYAVAAPAAVPGHVALLKNSEYGLAIDTDQRARAQRALLAGLALERKIGAAPLVANSLINLSDLALKERNFSEAAGYARDAMQAAQTLGSAHRAAVARFNLGLALLGQHQAPLNAEGKRHADAAIAVLAGEGDLPAMQSAWQEYADALEAAGDAPAALRALRRERSLSNQLFQKERQEAIWNLEEKFGAEKKAREIASLHQENALKSAQIDNARLQQKVWWLLAAALTFGAILTAFLYRQVRRANAHLKRSNLELKHQSSRDPLTGLYNRRHFLEAMRQQAGRAALAGTADSGALFLIDVDHFKHVNDAHGHGVGDQVLVMIASQLREILRETDMIVRWGGEEFLAWLPELKRSRLNEVAARLLAGISARPLLHQGAVIPVTVSIGYASFPLPGAGSALGWERLLHLVDMALYMAKSHGRNRAYGLAELASADSATLDALDAGLEQAWRAGTVDMAVVVGR
jgi:diguanylate cyclase (GGDEF)-like protein